MTIDTIVAKVQKLLRLAGNNSSPEESALAAAKAQALIDEHHLAQALLDIDAQTPVETLDEPIQNFSAPLDATPRLDRWRGALAMHLAKHNAVKVWSHNGRLMLVGRAGDAETVRYLYSWLVREVEQLATRAGAGQGRTWRNNFRLGVVETIARKLEEQHAAFTRASREVDNSQALVRVNNALARVEARATSVELWTKTHLKLSKGKAVHTTYDSGARAAGRAAGEAINLTSRTRVTSGAKGLHS